MFELENEQDEKPFSEVLDNLFGIDELAIANIYRLSDMPKMDADAFWEKWPQATPERRATIARHLADLVEDDFVLDYAPLFKRFLDDAHDPVRIAALDGLWDVDDVSLVNPILNLLTTDENVAVRAAAASALAHYVLLSEWGQLPGHISPKIVKVLLELYEQEGTAVPIKRAALEAMAAANHPRIEELIVEAYHNSNAEMRLSAVFAMGNSADTRWTATVLEELNSEDIEMRGEAARAAGIIGSSDAVYPLAQLVEEDDLDVAMVAVTSLGQIGSDEARSILQDMADNPDFEELAEPIAEAIEEIALLSGDIDFLSLFEDTDDDDDDEEYDY